jgi:hypothetical protein
MSFGFLALEDKWESKEVDGEPIDHRTITKARLYDVSPVTFPAYTQTDVSIRSVQEVAAEGRARIEEDVPTDSGEPEEAVPTDMQGLPVEDRERYLRFAEIDVEV